MSTFFLDIAEDDETNVCDLCGEGDGPFDDVVTEAFKRSEDGVHHVRAHGQCAEDFEYTLA